jgi:DNA-binding XRE family transcriptional regulator
MHVLSQAQRERINDELADFGFHLDEHDRPTADDGLTSWDLFNEGASDDDGDDDRPGWFERIEEEKQAEAIVEHVVWSDRLRQADETLARAFAEVLRQYREEETMTQAALAKRLGVKQEAVARWELGRQAPSHKTLYRVGERLGLRVDVSYAPCQLEARRAPVS